MLITADVEAARRTEVVKPVHDQPYRIWDYIGDAPDPEAPGYGTDLAANRAGGGAMRPQAYLVRQPPGSVTRPHFHQTNQFQVFVGGGGTVGKLRVDPVTVQYAGANTPYGPINAEAAGVDYFTLRQDWDSGAKWMPERRDVLVRGVQRQSVGAATGGDAVETLIEAAADGLLALCIRLAPDAELLFLANVDEVCDFAQDTVAEPVWQPFAAADLAAVAIGAQLNQTALTFDADGGVARVRVSEAC